MRAASITIVTLMLAARAALAAAQPPDPRFLDVTNLSGTFVMLSGGGTPITVTYGAFYPNSPGQFTPPTQVNVPGGGVFYLTLPVYNPPALRALAIDVQLPGADILIAKTNFTTLPGFGDTGRCRNFNPPPGEPYYTQPSQHRWFQYATPGIKSVTVTAYACKFIRTDVPNTGNGEWFESADIVAQATWTFHIGPDATLARVRAAIDEGPAIPTTGTPLPAVLRVPLGSTVRLETINEQGQPVPAEFSLDAAALESGLSARTLFADSVLYPYVGGPSSAATFQAVHKGTVTVAIAPTGTSVAGGVVTVVVENPSRLGDDNNDLDEAIFDVAHATGVLPQFVKAHVKQESLFNRLAYRYEPLSRWVGDLGAISRGRNLRTQAPFHDFRLAAAPDSLNDPGLQVGPLLSESDRDVRSSLYVECQADGSGGRLLRPDDVLVSAWEVVQCNDRTHGRMNWIANAGQDGRARAELIRTNPFTAQTPLAASFGLLQMTYAVAVLEMDWSGDAHGIKHPTYLLDTDSNHSFRLGSLRLGSEKIAKHFRQLQRGSGVHISDFQTLLLLFNEAWQQYNPGKRSYGFSIASMVGQYLPVAASPPMMGAQ